MSVACCMLPVAWCVRVRVLRTRVGAAIGCRLAALGVHSVATGRRRYPLHERVALAWLPCRRAAMRRSSPSRCSSEPTWRCRTPSGVLLDRAMHRAADTMPAHTVQAHTTQQTACKPTPCGVMGALDRAMCKVHRCGRQRAACEQSACNGACNGNAVLVCCSWTALMHEVLGGHTQVRHTHDPRCSCA